MNPIPFTIGMIAGLCDLASMMRVRNALTDLAGPSKAALDGFDLTADLYLIWWKISGRS